jgi:hypothetical protein
MSGERTGSDRPSERAPRDHLFGRLYLPRNRVDDDLAVLMMGHLALCSGRDLRAGEWVEEVLVDVVTARTVGASERLNGLDRVEDFANVRDSWRCGKRGSRDYRG